MKKVLTVLLVVLILATFLLAALPASASYEGWPGAPSDAVGGDPPGWSQVSPGNGGTGSPGDGPGAP
jgi:hypothetical protein